MGIWDKLFRREVKSSITTPNELAMALLSYGQLAASGIRVNSYNAMQCHAVAASIRVISETAAVLPLNLFKVDRNGKREIAYDHPLQKLLSNNGKPNGFQSSFDFREYGTRHIGLSGNAYFIKNAVRGQVRELLPLHPQRVEVRQEQDFSITYCITLPDGSKKDYVPADIFHLRGPSDNAFRGDPIVWRHADDIGLAMAQDKFAAMMFANGVKNSGTLQHPGKLSPEAYKRLKESFIENNGGLENAYKPMILEEGMAWETANQTMEESQLLESRKFQRSVIASIWRVPPHLIGDLENATFSNIESLGRQFIDYTMMPWLRRWEESIQLQLLTPVERDSYRIKFNVNALLRANFKDRASFYNTLTNIAALSPNEVRALEDMEPYEGGDEYRYQLNMTPAGQDDEQTDPEEKNPDEEPE